MTVQYIIVGFIIAMALLNVVLRFFKSITKPVNKCEGCSAGRGGCALHEQKSNKQ